MPTELLSGYGFRQPPCMDIYIYNLKIGGRSFVGLTYCASGTHRLGHPRVSTVRFIDKLPLPDSRLKKETTYKRIIEHAVGRPETVRLTIHTSGLRKGTTHLLNPFVEAAGLMSLI